MHALRLSVRQGAVRAGAAVTRPKDYKPAHLQRRRCAVSGCGRRVRIKPGKGRPERYCSTACRDRAGRDHTKAQTAKRSAERRLVVAQEEVMQARGYVVVGVAAERAGRSPQSVYNWLHAGKVASIRVGETWYVDETSLALFLAPKPAQKIRRQP